MELMAQMEGLVPAYMLVLARVTAMIMTMPILSYSVINDRVKVLFAVVLTFIITPLTVTVVPNFSSLVMLTVAITREVVIGMTIGFGARVLFEGFSMAGSFASRQMGLMIANIMDPTSQQQVPIISQFWILLVITFFLVSDSHHLFISTLFTNFTSIPIGGGEFPGKVGRIITQTGTGAFIISVKFAAPAITLLLVTDAAIALMARVMPQMNIFIVSLPLKLAVGLYALIASLNIFQVLFSSVYMEISRYLDAIVFHLGGTGA